MIERKRNNSVTEEFYRAQRRKETDPKVWWRNLNQLMVSYIDPVFFSIGDEQEFRDRLFRTLNGLYEVFRLNYGSEVAQQFIDLVYRFVVNGMNVVNSMYNTEQFVAEVNLNEWYQTTDEIAVFLSRLNDNWSAQTWVEYLYLYVNYVLELTRAVLEGNYEQSENIYRSMGTVTEQMGDYMTHGLAKIR
jgi:hypothetical protein